MSRQVSKKEALLRDARINRVCVCEDLDFYWDSPELKSLKKMWKKGISVIEIANLFERDPDEVLLALIHLAREEKIGQREGGLLS